MDDEKIVELYWSRDERAIGETQSKYGRYCYAIAFNILRVREDAEECENDAYLDAWNLMPPERPTELSSFLGMLTRRRALDRYRYKRAKKRGGVGVPIPICELEECLCAEKSLVDELAEEELARVISDFLYTLPERECNVFLRRYWFFDSIEDICRRYGFGESRVKMMLKRTREKLAKYLESEKGIFL